MSDRRDIAEREYNFGAPGGSRVRIVDDPNEAEILVIVRVANGDGVLAGEEIRSELRCGVKLYLLLEIGSIKATDLTMTKRRNSSRPAIDVAAEARYADDGNPLCDDNC